MQCQAAEIEKMLHEGKRLPAGTYWIDRTINLLPDCVIRGAEIETGPTLKAQVEAEHKRAAEEHQAREAERQRLRELGAVSWQDMPE